jgi:uncharacterized membrane protein (DUF2068 family)
MAQRGDTGAAQPAKRVRRRPGKREAMRLVALLEAAKGALVLLVAFGLHALLHRDAETLAVKLVGHLHLHPSSHFSRVFIEAASKLTDARLWMLTAFAAGYSALRLGEAWGLWFQRPWAEWLALVSGGIYLPLEFYELWQRPTLLRAGIVLVNLGIVVFMAVSLRQERQRAA